MSEDFGIRKKIKLENIRMRSSMNLFVLIILVNIN